MPRLTMFRSTSRAGHTLVELLITLMIMALVGTATTRVLSKQQQAYKDSAKQASMQRELRLAGSTLPAEMRSTSSSGGDILDMDEGHVEFMANIGSGIICAFSGGSHIVLPPTDESEITLTNWYTQPANGDSIFIYDDGPKSGSEDDAWIRGEVNSVQSNTSDCLGAPYTNPVLDAGKTRWRIGIGGLAIPPTVLPGSVVRFGRPVRYQLYEGPNTKEWYIGYQEHVNGGWTAIEPVSGPFRPFIAGDGTPSGMQLQYFDTLGVRITTNTSADRKRVSRIDVYLRTNAGLAAVTERRPAEVRDSLMMRVAIRNFK